METNYIKRHLFSIYFFFIFISYFLFPVFSENDFFTEIDLPFTEGSLFQFTCIGFQFNSLPFNFISWFSQISNKIFINYTMIGTLFIPILSLLALVTNYFKKNLFHVFTFLLSSVMFYYAVFFLLIRETPSIAYFIIETYFIITVILIGFRDGLKHASAYACLVPVIGFSIAAIMDRRPKLLLWYFISVLLIDQREPNANIAILIILLIFLLGHFLSFFIIIFSKKRQP